MKNLFRISVIVVLLSSTFNAKAQENTVAGGLSIFSDWWGSMVALNVRYNHYINDEFRVVPQIELGGGEANIFSVGCGANYLPDFLTYDDFQYYGSVILDYSVLFEDGFNEGGLGVRIDFIGFQYQIDNVTLFGESGLRIGGPEYYDPWVITLGAAFSLDVIGL